MTSLLARPRCPSHRYEPLQSNGDCRLCLGAKQAATDRSRSAKAFFKPRRKPVDPDEPELVDDVEADDDVEDELVLE